MTGKFLVVLSMVLLGLGLVAGTGFSVFMAVTQSLIWVVPAILGLVGVFHVGSFLVYVSDPTNGSK